MPMEWMPENGGAVNEQNFRQLVAESDTGIIVRDLRTYELLYANEAACRMLGVPPEGYEGRKCHEYFYGSAEPCAFCRPPCAPGECTDGPLYVPHRDQFFTMRTVVVDWTGRAASVEYLDDVTDLERSHRRIDDLVHNVPCGICLYRWTGGALEPVLANSQFSELLGEDAIAYMGSVRQMDYTHVHPDDLPVLQAAVRRALTETHQIDYTYRMLNSRLGTYQWIRLRGSSIQQPDGAWLVYASYLDVTRDHENEQRLREKEWTLETAADMAGLWYWTYDTALDRAWLDIRNQRDFGLPPVMDDFMETWLSMGFIHPDDRDLYRDAFARVMAGEETVTFEIRFFDREGGLHWARCLLAAVGAEEDGRLMILGTALPIDAEKALQSKYELERRKLALSGRTLLVRALFDLTGGATLEYTYQDGTEVPPEERLAFTGGEDRLKDLLIDDGERAAYRALNDREYLLGCYERGETELSLDYRRILPGREPSWVRNILHLVRDPDSGGVLLFEYCYDVEEEKTRALLYHSLATDNYDYVVRINGRDRSYTAVHRQEHGDQLPLDGKDADEISRQIALRVPPEERAEVLRNILVAGMRENLKDRERFQFTCRMADEDGTIQYKKITQYYIDRQRDILVMLREDVSAVVRAEMEKNAVLAGALEAAQQASRAKSQFLSRMSHELRTPMNAIIGLAALAAGETDNQAAMEDAIGKIGLSARYLLSLINDILEMSRIESGRMTLNEGPIDFEQLISSVNGIIYAQAAEKGLDYDAVVSSYTESSYIGDGTKLQQILLNVLGNAVKFTPAGGKVTFGIEQLRRSKDQATLRFMVSDTGVGIDEEFLPHLFDPFAQESASFTSTSTGTGLGLAITKSMVEMMNGSIRVQSMKNVGSTFTLEVQLGISEDSRSRLDRLAALNLSRLRALIVDDDVVVCRSTEKTLSAMGIRAEWVDSGPRAVERVVLRHRENSDFDTIFIDWKMPDMDGIETTRQIRRVVGPEVTIIILTAYDWKAIEMEARAAGADLFMEKPLFQSSIVNAFEHIFSAHREKIVVPPPRTFDFTGKHILLAEDQPLNVEIAKRLLERAGAAVTVAGNGLEALETFTTAETGAFDAILMDVRMPIMDGLTAARSIRNLKKDGSKSIPIIAMTANAFDEDVKLSLANGMDAHLTKPIESQLLFATLQKLMDR